MTNLEEKNKNKPDTTSSAPKRTPYNKGSGNFGTAGNKNYERAAQGDRRPRTNNDSSSVGGSQNRQRRTFDGKSSDGNRPRGSFEGGSKFERRGPDSRRSSFESFGKKEYFSEKKSGIKNDEQKLINQENQKRKRDLNKSSINDLGIYATGRRKTSSARVWIKKGSGKFTVNNKELSEYFKADLYNVSIFRPFEVTNTINNFDVWCTVKGGGFTGQSDAIKLGIARALDVFNEDFRPLLKQEGLLTRDSRMVERKKYGKHGARKSTQFSKR